MLLVLLAAWLQQTLKQAIQQRLGGAACLVQETCQDLHRGTRCAQCQARLLALFRDSFIHQITHPCHARQHYILIALTAGRKTPFGVGLHITLVNGSTQWVKS